MPTVRIGGEKVSEETERELLMQQGIQAVRAVLNSPHLTRRDKIDLLHDIADHVIGIAQGLRRIEARVAWRALHGASEKIQEGGEGE